MTERIPTHAQCNTCRHSEPSVDKHMGYTAEEAAQVKRYPLFCRRAEMENGLATDPQTLAVTMDGSSYRASLLVAPEFACVMYEDRAASPENGKP